MTTSQYSSVLVERPFVTRRLFRKLLVAACILLITLGALEVAVRVWGYSERHIYDPIYTAFDRTGDIPYVHKPNLERARARGLAVINTDSLGLRAKIAGASYGAKQPNEFRIALVGDSFTFGEGVARTEDTFVQVLEDSLNQGQQAVTVKALNFGASAYSVKEMAATLQYRMVDIQPDLVVMAIIPSDFNLARTPVIDESGYLIDQRLSYWSPSGSMALQMVRGIHLTYVLRDIGVRWFFKRPDVGQVLAGGEIPETYTYVRQFKTTAEQRGVPYVIMLLPRVQQGTWGRVPDQLTRDNITHIDLSFLGNEFTEEQYMASRFDPHPSPAVHHRIGETLADYVRHNQLKSSQVQLN
jgi:hypothetical protein